MVAAHQDTRARFTVAEDQDRPPPKSNVVRVRTAGYLITRTDRGEVVMDPSVPYDPARVRTYLRTEQDLWVRDDQVELDTAVAGLGVIRAVTYPWSALIDQHLLLIAEPRLVDADFDTIREWEWTVVNAEGTVGRVIRDIHFHNMSDGEWGDFSGSPATRLATLDDAMGRLSAAVTEANDLLRMIRLQLGKSANQRWKANLAAHEQRIQQAHRDRLAGELERRGQVPET